MTLRVVRLLNKLFDKFKTWLISKPDEVTLSGAPDSDVNSVRELPTPEEKRLRWVTLFKIKF